MIVVGTTTKLSMSNDLVLRSQQNLCKLQVLTSCISSLGIPGSQKLHGGAGHNRVQSLYVAQEKLAEMSFVGCGVLSEITEMLTAEQRSASEVLDRRFGREVCRLLGWQTLPPYVSSLLVSSRFCGVRVQETQSLLLSER